MQLVKPWGHTLSMVLLPLGRRSRSLCHISVTHKRGLHFLCGPNIHSMNKSTEHVLCARPEATEMTQTGQALAAMELEI